MEFPNWINELQQTLVLIFLTNLSLLNTNLAVVPKKVISENVHGRFLFTLVFDVYKHCTQYIKLKSQQNCYTSLLLETKCILRLERAM